MAKPCIFANENIRGKIKKYHRFAEKPGGKSVVSVPMNAHTQAALDVALEHEPIDVVSGRFVVRIKGKYHTPLFGRVYFGRCWVCSVQLNNLN